MPHVHAARPLVPGGVPGQFPFCALDPNSAVRITVRSPQPVAPANKRPCGAGEVCGRSLLRPGARGPTRRGGQACWRHWLLCFLSSTLVLGSWVSVLGSSWPIFRPNPRPETTEQHRQKCPACPARLLGGRRAPCVVWWPFPFLVVRWPFPFLPVERQQGILPWVLRQKLSILLLSRPRENTQHLTCRALSFVYIRRTTRSNDRYLGHRNHITHHHHHVHSRSATSIISFYYITMHG